MLLRGKYLIKALSTGRHGARSIVMRTLDIAVVPLRLF
jgi:hypothetical protein